MTNMCVFISSGYVMNVCICLFVGVYRNQPLPRITKTNMF